MVDSLSRSPSSINTPGQASLACTDTGGLIQGSARRSQSPGATSLVSQGRSSMQSEPQLQQGPARSSRASPTYAAQPPSPELQRPRMGGLRLPPMPQSLSGELNARTL